MEWSWRATYTLRVPWITISTCPKNVICPSLILAKMSLRVHGSLLIWGSGVALQELQKGGVKRLHFILSCKTIGLTWISNGLLHYSFFFVEVESGFKTQFIFPLPHRLLSPLHCSCRQMAWYATNGTSSSLPLTLCLLVPHEGTTFRRPWKPAVAKVQAVMHLSVHTLLIPWQVERETCALQFLWDSIGI